MNTVFEVLEQIKKTGKGILDKEVTEISTTSASRIVDSQFVPLTHLGITFEHEGTEYELTIKPKWKRVY